MLKPAWDLRWWTLIRDLRTALAKDHLPMEVVKGLLGAAARA